MPFCLHQYKGVSCHRSMVSLENNQEWDSCSTIKTLQGQPGMLHLPLKLDVLPDKVLQLGGWVAWYHWIDRCIEAWSQWGDHWQTNGNPPYRVPLPVARSHQMGPCLCGKSYRKHHQLLPRTSGSFFLFLVIEVVAGDWQDKHIALYSNSSSRVHWVQWLAVKSSLAAMQLIHTKALQLQITKALPLTTLHIAVQQKSMMDIPSRSFGSKAKWHCASNESFLTLYNSLFPLPTQESWTLFRLSLQQVQRVLLIAGKWFYNGRVAMSTKIREIH